MCVDVDVVSPSVIVYFSKYFTKSLLISELHLQVHWRRQVGFARHRGCQTLPALAYMCLQF